MLLFRQFGEADCHISRAGGPEQVFYDQASYSIRCEWGAQGIAHLAAASDVVIIVDVLSFCTSVDVAVARGAEIYPYLHRDESATRLAQEIGGVAAGAHRDTGQYTLSPASLLNIEKGTRLVLPSPNGATLSLATGGKPTLAGCLRNAESVAQAATTAGSSILIVPAGERWSDGTLRFSIEDYIGAGAIAYYLAERINGDMSPEAQAALNVFASTRSDLHATLAGSSSGCELIERGFARDVELAAELNISITAPLLRDGAYGRA